MGWSQPDDGTRQLLLTGIWTLATGVLAAFLTGTVFGGIGRQGPHTNMGWIFLLIALGCLPFGSMAFLLGGLKWLRNRRIAASQPSVTGLPLQPVSPDPESLLSFTEHTTEQDSHGKKRQ
ncbi:MAG TPA: hypothetical protein VMU92_12225 [Acidobacteriaceae bacterium]|nr:hypothetical protein [Acidobacteriaceae bacterium]